MNRLVINSVTREKRFALLKEGKLERLYIEQPGQQSLVGSIFLGTVEKVLPGMNAAFVNFGEEKSGFLSRDKLPSYVLDTRSKAEKANMSISSYTHQGEKLLVQVEKDAAGTKGARLTAIVEIQGDHCIYMPSGKYIAISKKACEPSVRQQWRSFGEQIKMEEEGLIIRTSALSQSEETINNELAQLREHYHELQLQAKNSKKPGLIAAKDFYYDELTAEINRLTAGEIIVDDQHLKKKLEQYVNDQGKSHRVHFYKSPESIFSFYGIDKEIEGALKRIVWLENGAYLIFDEAEALTIIDVNTGKYAGKNNLKETVVATNMLAAAEIARQLRLRDLGGMVLIDFIDMKDERDQFKVAEILEAGLAADGRRTRIAGFTSLGILQLTRKKTKISISEALTENCSVCNGLGKVLSAETIAFRLERELWEYRHSDFEAALIVATTEVVSIFSGVNDVHRLRIEEALGLKIFFSNLASPRPEYSIRQLGTVQELAGRAGS